MNKYLVISLHPDHSGIETGRLNTVAVTAGSHQAAAEARHKVILTDQPDRCEYIVCDVGNQSAVRVLVTVEKKILSEIIT